MWLICLALFLSLFSLFFLSLSLFLSFWYFWISLSFLLLFMVGGLSGRWGCRGVTEWLRVSNIGGRC